MTNLATFPWTNGDDLAIGLSSAYLAAGQSASSGNGNDVIIGVGVFPGINVLGFSNEDQFIAGEYVGPSGVYLGAGSTLNTGNGNDFIGGTGANGLNDPTSTALASAGNGGDGIRNRGTILTGNGSDIAVGVNLEFGPIIRGQGGNGANGTSSLFNDGSDGGDGGAGIRNLGSGTIKTGNGRDLLFGTGGNGGDGGNGYISMSGDNRNGGDGGAGGDGIHNDTGGNIETGNGHDAIVGIGGNGGAAGLAGNGANSKPGDPGRDGYGIYNDGLIDLGRGDDLIDASSGGFGGNGTVKLGLGSDVVKGFGSGTFIGDKGFDTLVFAAGTYSVAAADPGFFAITTSSMMGVTMRVSGFESINGQSFGTGDFVIA